MLGVFGRQEGYRREEMIRCYIERQVRNRPFVLFDNLSYHSKFPYEVHIYGVIFLGICFEIEIRPKEKTEVKCFVTCSRCGKRVSNVVLSLMKEGIVVRAWVECPECMDKK